MLKRDFWQIEKIDVEGMKKDAPNKRTEIVETPKRTKEYLTHSNSSMTQEKEDKENFRSLRNSNSNF